MDKKSNLSQTRINLDITNESFEKMRTDPSYEKKILGILDAQLEKQYPLPPVSITVTANAEGEDGAIDYGQKKNMFEKRGILGSVQRSLLRGGVESMRSEVLTTLQSRLGGGGASGLTLMDTIGGGGTGMNGFDLYA